MLYFLCNIFFQIMLTFFSFQNFKLLIICIATIIRQPLVQLGWYQSWNRDNIYILWQQIGKYYISTVLISLNDVGQIPYSLQ